MPFYSIFLVLLVLLVLHHHEASDLAPFFPHQHGSNRVPRGRGQVLGRIRQRLEEVGGRQARLAEAGHAAAELAGSTAKPRNPRHFETIEGSV